MEKLKPSLYLGGYYSTLELLERHPIRKATLSDETRDTLSSVLNAGAELGWPSRVMTRLCSCLKACSADKGSFAKGVAERVDKITDRVLQSQVSLSRAGLRDAEVHT